MTKAKKGSKGQRRDDQERKRDERARRNALRKENKDKYCLEDGEDFVSFSNQLEAQGLKIREIIGDGNCLFRALGDQLDGDHNTHALHRRETVRFMREHRQDFEPFMEDNISFEKHLQELSKLGTYGGNESIVAFARNHGVNVVIHQLNEPRWVISGAEYTKTGQVIELHISYHNGEHYSSVRSLFHANSCGPAWLHFKDITSLNDLGKRTEGVNKKGKKTKETTSRENTTPARAEGYRSAVDQCHSKTAAEQSVMEATGCKDLALVAQTLEENMYDIDLSIAYVLQMMCVAEEQGFASSELCFCGDQTEAAETEQTKDLKEADLVHSCSSRNKENSSCIPNTEITNGTNHTSMSDEIPRSRNDIRKDVKSSVAEDSSEPCPGMRTNNDQKCVEKADTPSDSCSKVSKAQGARPKVDTSKPRAGQTNAHLSNKKRKQLAKQEKKKNREERRKLEAEKGDVDSTSVAVASVLPDLGALAI